RQCPRRRTYRSGRRSAPWYCKSDTQDVPCGTSLPQEGRTSYPRLTNGRTQEGRTQGSKGSEAVLKALVNSRTFAKSASQYILKAPLRLFCVKGLFCVCLS